MFDCIYTVPRGLPCEGSGVLIARDTVWEEKPASAATSASVAAPVLRREAREDMSPCVSSFNPKLVELNTRLVANGE